VSKQGRDIACAKLCALGQRRFDVILAGMDVHAGPTPMPLRKDAMLGLARRVGAVNRIALDEAALRTRLVQIAGGTRIAVDLRQVVQFDACHFDAACVASVLLLAMLERAG
jgi:N-carbamoyl-L-amino-acid hydrolase